MTYPASPGFAPTDTSREAADKIAPHVSRPAGEILAALEKGARTCYALEIDLKLSHQSASARITELRLAGLIEDSGQRKFTGTGRRAIVWRVKP